jgi:hypothetical protein
MQGVQAAEDQRNAEKMTMAQFLKVQPAYNRQHDFNGTVRTGPASGLQ